MDDWVHVSPGPPVWHRLLIQTLWASSYAIVLLTTLNRREEHRGDHVESGFGFATVESTNLELSTVNGRSRYGDQTIGHSTTSLPASTVPHDERSAHDSLTVNEPDVSILPAKP
jgi:hypothetical protein